MDLVAAFEGESFSKQKCVIALSETMLTSAQWPQSIIWPFFCSGPRAHAFVLVFIVQWGLVLKFLRCVFSAGLV